MSLCISGFRLQKGLVRALERRFKKVVSKTQKCIQFIDSIEACSGNLSRLKLRSGLTSGQISAKVQKLIERNGVLNRNAENLLKLFNLAKAVQEIIQQHPNAFNTLKFLEKEVRKKNPQLNFSFFNLYRVFRMQGFRWKKNVFRVN